MMMTIVVAANGLALSTCQHGARFERQEGHRHFLPRNEGGDRPLFTIGLRHVLIAFKGGGLRLFNSPSQGEYLTSEAKSCSFQETVST